MPIEPHATNFSPFYPLSGNLPIHIWRQYVSLFTSIATIVSVLLTFHRKSFNWTDYYFRSFIVIANTPAGTFFCQKSTVETTVETNNDTYCLQKRIEKFPLNHNVKWPVKRENGRKSPTYISYLYLSISLRSQSIFATKWTYSLLQKISYGEFFEQTLIYFLNCYF